MSAHSANEVQDEADRCSRPERRLPLLQELHKLGAAAGSLPVWTTCNREPDVEVGRRLGLALRKWRSTSQLPVLLAHRCQHVLAGRAHPDRAGMAGLEVRVGVLLPVALHVSPAAAANAHVASLDGSGLLPRRVVEVRLDRRGRATETVRDLLDREPLERDAEPSRRSAGGRGPMASQPRCTAGPLPPALNSRWSRRSGRFPRCPLRPLRRPVGRSIERPRSDRGAGRARVQRCSGGGHERESQAQPDREDGQDRRRAM